jgi:hypothetical protein
MICGRPTVATDEILFAVQISKVTSARYFLLGLLFVMFFVGVALAAKRDAHRSISSLSRPASTPALVSAVRDE